MRARPFITLLLGGVLFATVAPAAAARAQTPPDTTLAGRTAAAQRDSLRRDSAKARLAAARDSARRDSARRAAETRSIAATAALLRTSGVAALVLLALFTGGLLFLCLAEIRNGHPPALESHWGGFGGAGGGWRMSPSLTYLVVALLFGAMLTALGAKMFDAARELGGRSAQQDSTSTR